VVLASTLFLRAPDLSKILKYVCERHFSNQADAIKEYSVAVEALGRGPSFRPEEDSIVRVQAARLRKQLKRYYETDGADHAVQIRISSTGYRPEFVYTRAAEDRVDWVAVLDESSPVATSENGTALARPGAPRPRHREESSL